VNFLGVNLDDAAAGYNAMKDVSARGWFWPQALAQEGTNKRLADLGKFEVDRPTMALVGKDGTIVYMGSPTGFLPKMLMARVTDNYKPKLFVPVAKDPNSRRARLNDPNAVRRRAADPNLPKAKVRTPAEEDAFRAASEIQAETIYNNAKAFMKSPTPLTAGRGVQLCREILEQYPDTSFAPKARELLRALPDDLKTKYSVTNAEMGI
jgi:hypothetical protein